MQAEELIKTGQVTEALAALEQQIRSNPSEIKYRIFLFQILSVLGQWERAMTQLNVVGEMDSANLLFTHSYRPALQSEAFREQVFSAGKTPLIFGEPAEWLGLIVQANQLFAQQNYSASRQMLDQAFEQAPAVSGTINGNSFEWIADADSRLGPILEVIVDGKYYWAPFSAMKRIVVEEPADLRDMVWVDAVFTWTNGGESSGLIPVRYTGTHSDQDDAVKMARKTRWQEYPEDFFIGFGQRVLTTDAEEIPLLEVREIIFETEQE